MGRASQRRNHYNLRWPGAEVLRKQINPAGQIQVCEDQEAAVEVARQDGDEAPMVYEKGIWTQMPETYRTSTGTQAI